jgi:SAM-dependent methyltransferase
MATPMHEQRNRAESFGEDPELYDRVRPTYPVQLIDDLMSDEPADVIDVGCGTGIVSRLFLARGCRVLGVEVDERMAEYARSTGVNVEVGRFETWDPKGRDFDLLVSGQAWHWVEPVAGAGAAAHCLRSGARFCVFWNRQMYPDDVSRVMLDVYGRIAPGLIDKSPLIGSLTPRTPSKLDEDPVVAALTASGAFQPAEYRRYEWEREYTVAEWLGHARTSSDHRQLDPSVLADLLAALESELEALGGHFLLSYRTNTLTALRT